MGGFPLVCGFLSRQKVGVWMGRTCDRVNPCTYEGATGPVGQRPRGLTRPQNCLRRRVPSAGKVGFSHLGKLSEMLDGNTVKYTLLTGAGLSWNWGGRLASELWQDVMGHPQVQQSKALRDLLIAEPSFEVALARCRVEDFSNAERAALETATFDSFLAMDRQIAGRWDAHGWINIFGFQSFLNRFCRRCDGDTTYLFTLNQDLFLERHWYNFNNAQPIPRHPGIPSQRFSNGSYWFSTGIPPFEDEMRCVPTWQGETDFSGRVNYIKLHGSFNWHYAGGTSTMVVGNQKAQQILAQPLLAQYSQTFGSVINKGGTHLMVIGYGFSDDHINAALATAARDHGLRVFIWDTGFDAIRAKLAATDDGRVILASLISGCSRSMIEVFPSNQEETEEIRRINGTFFT